MIAIYRTLLFTVRDKKFGRCIFEIVDRNISEIAENLPKNIKIFNLFGSPFNNNIL